MAVEGCKLILVENVHCNCVLHMILLEFLLLQCKSIYILPEKLNLGANNCE